MYENNTQILQRMAPRLQRVLVCDPNPASAKLLAELMRSLARSQIWIASDTDRALKMAATVDPQVIFVELAAVAVDGLDFTRRLRRSTLACRYAPVVMVTSQATAAGILAARDAGVHEFLRKPFTTKDLMRRLEAVTLRDRDWVEAVGYIGPDRRRFNSGDYSGPLKRRSDQQATPDEAKLTQALKILRSAIPFCDLDPSQAMRSMQAQVAELQTVGVAVSDLKLTTAAIDFGRYLNELERAGGEMPKAELEKRAAPLLAYMPKDADLAAYQAA